MPESDFANLTLFITGPTYLRDAVREAGLLPEFGHRDSENEKRVRPIMERLKAIAQVGDDYQVALYNGSGSTVMESSLRSLVADDEIVLHVTVGAFGDLYHKMAVQNGKQAAQLKFAPGRAMTLAELEKALVEHEPAVVGITHNETSTGVTNDITQACDLIRKHGALPLVDGVSIFGGGPSEIASARPAMYCTSTQKALGLPAGFGIAFIGQDAVDKAARVTNRGFASDILNQLGRARKFQTLTTPNTTLLNQMYVQLRYIVNEETVDKRFARHAAMREQTLAFVDALPGFEPFAPEGHRSPTLTCVRAREGLDMAGLKRVKEAMRARGYLFDPGYGKLNEDLEAAGERPVFRIGHMGDITPDMLARYLDELGLVLRAI